MTKRATALLIFSLTFAHAQDSPNLNHVSHMEEIVGINSPSAETRYDSGVKTEDVKFTITGPRDLVEVEEFLRGATFYVQPAPPRATGRALVASAAVPPKPVLIRRTMCQHTETAATCPQPKTYRSVNAPFPLDAPVRAGGETHRREWVWLKAEESTAEVFGPSGRIERVVKQCTAAQKQDKQWRYSCSAKIGQPLYITWRWRDEVVK